MQKVLLLTIISVVFLFGCGRGIKSKAEIDIKNFLNEKIKEAVSPHGANDIDLLGKFVVAVTASKDDSDTVLIGRPHRLSNTSKDICPHTISVDDVKTQRILNKLVPTTFVRGGYFSCEYSFGFNKKYAEYLSWGYDKLFKNVYLFLPLYEVKDVSVIRMSDPADSFGKKVRVVEAKYSVTTTKLGELLGCPSDGGQTFFDIQAYFASYDDGWKFEHLKDFDAPLRDCSFPKDLMLDDIRVHSGKYYHHRKSDYGDSHEYVIVRGNTITWTSSSSKYGDSSSEYTLVPEEVSAEVYAPYSSDDPHVFSFSGRVKTQDLINRFKEGILNYEGSPNYDKNDPDNASFIARAREGLRLLEGLTEDSYNSVMRSSFGDCTPDFSIFDSNRFLEVTDCKYSLSVTVYNKIE